MRISDICKERRSQLKLSNQSISDQSGIHLQTINNFFSQRSQAPSIYTVGPICRVLGVSLDEVFEIIAPGMGQEEIQRIKEHSEFNQEELLKFQKEAEQYRISSDHQLEMQAQQLVSHEQTIRMQDDRIKYQKRAISIHRWIIFSMAAFMVCFAVFALWVHLR